jgi:hypothetical protein
MKFPIEHPSTQKKMEMRGDLALMLRLWWNGLQGDNTAIKEILERIDGAVTQKVESQVNVTQMGTVKIEGKPLQIKIGQ